MLKIKWILISSIFIFIGCSPSLKLISKAEIAENNYNFSTAITLYKKVLIKSPKNNVPLFKLAKYYFRNGKSHLGILLLKKTQPKITKEKNMLLAKYYLKQGDYSKASFFINIELIKNKNDIEVITLKKQINNSRFWHRCRHKIKNFPKNEIYRKQLAYSLLKNGQKYSGIREFEEIIQINPNNKTILLLLAKFYLNENITKKAKEYLKLIRKIDYKNRYALFSLGNIERDNHRLWKARHYFYLNLRFHPNDPQGNEKFGQINLQVGKKDDGHKYLKEAVRLGIKNYSIYNTLAQLEEKNGNRIAALYYKKLAQGYSHSQKSKKNHYDNKIRVSIKQLKRFLTFFSDNSYKKANISIQLAKNLSKIGRFKEAYIYLKNSRKIMGNSFPLNLYIGQIEYRLGYLQNSLISLQKCIRINPKKPLPYIEISKIYKSTIFKDSIKYLKILKQGLIANKKSTKLLAMLGNYYIPSNNKKAIYYYKQITPKTQPILKKIKWLQKDIVLTELKNKIDSNHNDKNSLKYALQVRKIAGENHPLYLKALEMIKMKSSSVHFLLGDIYTKNFFSSFFYKDLQNGLNHYKLGLKTKKDSIIIYKHARLLAWDYKNRQKLKESFKILQKRDWLKPNSTLENLISFQNNWELVANRLFTVGKIIYNKNKNIIATKYIEKSWDISHNEYPEMLLALGSIYRDFRLYKKALKQFKKLSRQKEYLTGNNYPVTLTVIGNLYGSIAKNFPQSATDLVKNFQLKKMDLPFLRKIRKVISEAKNRGAFYYKRYASLYEKHYIHRNYGIKKASSIANIKADNFNLIKRVASLFIKSGLTKQGLTFIRQGLSLKPDRRDFPKKISLFLAETLSKSNKKKEGIKLYYKLLKQYPNDWRIMLSYTKNLIADNKLKKSKLFLEKLSRINKGNSEINSLFGFVLWKSGEIKRSIYYLKKSHEQNSKNLKTPFWIASIYMQENNTSAGIKFSNKVYEIFKKSLAFNYGNKISKSIFLLTLGNLSSLHFYQGNIEKSMKFAQEGAILDNNHNRYFNVQIGDILFLQKKYFKAEESYKIAKKHHPNSQVISFKLAQNMVKINKIVESKQLLQTIIKSKSNFQKLDRVYLLLAHIYKKLGRREKALSTLKIMKRLFPHNEDAYLAISEIFEDKNMQVSAKDILLEGLKTIEQAPLLRDKLAWFFIKNNRNPMRALHLAMENCSKYPANLNYKATLSYIYLKIRDFKKYALNFPTLKTIDNINNKKRTTALFAMENAQKCFAAGKNKKALDLIKGSIAKDSNIKAKQNFILAHLD